MPRTAASSLAVAAALAAACLSVSGCGSASAGSTRAFRVTLHDFKIDAPARLPAGEVDLVVHNNGPDEHELIVVRATQPLPLRSDGITADEDKFEKRTVGALEPGAPG